MSKERLEEIKNRRKKHDMDILPVWAEDIDWLIERIEELEEILLQTNYDAALLEKRTEELLKLNEQNKRYREAIEFGIEYLKNSDIRQVQLVVTALKSALEGDDD